MVDCTCTDNEIVVVDSTFSRVQQLQDEIPFLLPPVPSASAGEMSSETPFPVVEASPKSKGSKSFLMWDVHSLSLD